MNRTTWIALAVLIALPACKDKVDKSAAKGAGAGKWGVDQHNLILETGRVDPDCVHTAIAMTLDSHAADEIYEILTEGETVLPMVIVSMPDEDRLADVQSALDEECGISDTVIRTGAVTWSLRVDDPGTGHDCLAGHLQGGGISKSDWKYRLESGSDI